MTTRSLTLVHAAFFVALLIVSLAPGTARSQDQQQTQQTEERRVPEAIAPAPEQEESSSTEVLQPAQDAVPPAPNGSSAEEQQPTEVVIPSAESQAPAESQAAQATPRTGQVYIVKKGDTLWDISNSFLRDPFLWPFIWKANPSIENPDLIYPGDRLVMPSLEPVERAMQEPSVDGEPPLKERPKAKAPAVRPEVEPETPEEARAPGSRLILPEKAPVPIIDKYSMLNAGFINMVETGDKIVGSKEPKTMLSYDDIVFVALTSKKDAVPGDKFLIFKTLGKVKHPITLKTYGNLIKVLGIMELTGSGAATDIYSGRITISFDGIGIGSMLTPYQEPSLIYSDPSQVKDKDISGYILEVVDTRSLNATTDIVYLDKGSADGVEPGDLFVVYGKPEKAAFPKPVIGETQVFLVKERTSTAIVRKSSNMLSKGNLVVYKKLPQQ